MYFWTFWIFILLNAAISQFRNSVQIFTHSLNIIILIYLFITHLSQLSNSPNQHGHQRFIYHSAHSFLTPLIGTAIKAAMGGEQGDWGGKFMDLVSFMKGVGEIWEN
jgi:hypothetical protein